MSGRLGDLGTMNRLALTIVMVGAVVAVVLLNVLLLDRASAGSDPIGKLSPIAGLSGPSLRPAPAGVVRPTTGPIEGENRDD